MNYYVTITVDNQPGIILNIGDGGKAYDVYADTKDALGNFALIQLINGDTYEIICSSDENQGLTSLTPYCIIDLSNETKGD